MLSQLLVLKPPTVFLRLLSLQLFSLPGIHRCWWLIRNLLWFPLAPKPFLKRLTPGSHPSPDFLLDLPQLRPSALGSWVLRRP